MDERVAVIGCGTMGHSIALNIAWAGLHVTMYGLDQADTGRAEAALENKLGNLHKNDLITNSEIVQIRDRIHMEHSLDKAAAGASFIIETIPEETGLKNELFRYLDKICARRVILASNTSGLGINDIAAGIKHPERVLVTHFWNPAHLIPLVEVVKGIPTSDAVLRRTLTFLRRIGKQPIRVKKEIPGLVGNRLQFALFREAQHLLAEGIASKEDIDAAVVYSIGRRLSVTGPFMSADMGGLDVFNTISEYLFRDLSKADDSDARLQQLVKDGKLGDKTGEGYYKWDNEFSKEMNQERELELMRWLKKDRGE